MGTAIDFGGLNDTIYTPASPHIDIGSSQEGFTIEFWIDPDANQSSGPIFEWSGNTERAFRLMHEFERGFRLIDGDLDIWRSGYVHENSGWIHVAITYERDLGLVNLYQSGVLTNTYDVGDREFDTSGDFWIGGRPILDSTFNGALDEFTLYQRPLNDSEIVAIYTAGAAGKCQVGDNEPPLIIAGSEFNLILPESSLLLSAFIHDEGLPLGGALTADWSLASGAGSVVFATPSVIDPVDGLVETSATFSLPGYYIVELAVSDGEFTTINELHIHVEPERNTAPLVEAGDALSLYIGTSANLSGRVSDDGAPADGSLGFSWSVVSGPGQVSFSDNALLDPTVTFSDVGVYVLRLSADDGALTAFDELEVEVLEIFAPTVEITQPVGGATLALGSQIQLIATAANTDETINSVEFFLDGSSVGLGAYAGGGEYFVGPISFPLAGVYNISALATNSKGLQTLSSVNTLRIVEDTGFDLTLDIQFPGEGGVITAPSEVIGSASATEFGAYSLEYRLLGESQWLELVTSNHAVVDGPLGTIDPTLLLNGVYELRLTAFDVFGRSSSVHTTFVVDGDMKVGNFALAFEDLTVPMAGIPIQIIRSYDSRDTRMGDFGTGWTMAVNDIRLRKNNNLGAEWNQQLTLVNIAGAGETQAYCLEPVGKRLVSVTFPDGAQHLFEMSVDVGHGRQDIDPNCQLFVPISQSEVVFTPKGDTTSSLQVVGQSTVYSYSFTGSTELFTTDPATDFGAQLYNPTQFILTTSDGTRYLLDEDEGLISMEDLNGNKLEVFDDRITSTTIDPNGGADIVREVTFLRDGEGRITSITDPDGNTLDYGYEVGQGGLRTFTNRVDETTEFIYADTRFPDYLTDILDPRGVQAIRTEYDDEGRIARQIDADGNPIDFDHDINNFAERVTDRLGNTTTYFYNDLGNVTRQVDPLGAETLFEYYPGTTLVKYETDDLGNVTSRAYDDQENLLVEITGASISEEPLTATTGYITRYTYNEFSSPLSITDPNGNLTEFTYDGQGNLLTQVQHGNGSDTLTTTFTYHSSGDIQSITDAEGNVTSYTYAYGISDPQFPDAVKRQTVFVTDANLGVLRVTESLYDQQENLLVERYNRTLANGQTEVVSTSYLYDEENRLVATFLPDGQVAETRYNTIGKEAASIRWQSVADYQSDNLALARVTTMAYDARGNHIRTDYPDGTFTQMGYNLEGRMIWSANQLGEVTAMAYDALGRQTHTLLPGGTSSASPEPVEVVSSADLDGLSWNSYVELPPVLADFTVTESIYDSIGRVEFTVDAVGNLTQNIYDDACACAGRLKATRSFPDPGDTSTYLETSYLYDENGNQRFVTDPKGNVTEFVYDAYNRLVQTNHPKTAEHGTTNTRTEYDALGRRVATLDEEGKRTEFSYDALGRLLEVRQEHPTENWSTGNWTTTSYTYDEAGNRLSETDAEGNTTRFEYDSMGRRTRRILPEGQEETYLYNAWGELQSRTDFKGHVTTYTYDDMSRILTERADATAFPTEVGITYTYDALGRIETMTDASGSTTHDYDARGNLLSKVNAVGTLAYTYDEANNLKSTVSGSAGGLNLGYDYDGLNRLSTVTDSGAAQPPLEHSYGYDANGNLETLTYSNVVVHTWTYDSRNRLKNLSLRNAGFTNLQSYEYSLNASGHRSQVVEASGRTVGYFYDNQYRLTQESISGDPNALLNGTSDWTYDLVGNRLSQASSVDSVFSVVESYSDNNWLDSHTYDSNGNTTSSASYAEPAITLADHYDWRNRLIRRERSDGTVIEVVYDGNGDRVRKNVQTSPLELPISTFYLVDRNNLTGYAQVVEEITQGGAVQVIYSYGLDLISQDRYDASTDSWTQSFYHYDGLGSVRALTDSAGSVTDEYTYDAWGVLLNSTTNQQQATTNSYLFTGEQWDADLEMYFLRARYLNTSTGRFHTMDTFEGVTTDPVTLHKYLYANAAPNMWTDPTGKWTLSQTAVVGGIIGLLSSMANVAFNYENMSGGQIAAELIAGTVIGAVTGGIGSVSSSVIRGFVQRFIWMNPWTKSIAAGALGGATSSFLSTFMKELVDFAIYKKPITFEEARASGGRIVKATFIGFGVGAIFANISYANRASNPPTHIKPSPQETHITWIDTRFVEEVASSAGLAGQLGSGALKTIIKKVVSAAF
ncbi:MAG: LamG-like jellyroll fold domain-containing protein [Opitutales bacterium]